MALMRVYNGKHIEMTPEEESKFLLQQKETEEDNNKSKKEYADLLLSKVSKLREKFDDETIAIIFPEGASVL